MDLTDCCVLDILDVLCQSKTHMRPLVEGAEVLKTGILSIGKVSASENVLEVFALVMQSSHIDEAPHGVTVRITSENGKKDIRMKCSCIGGTPGSCKHSLAVAMRLTKLRASELEEVSCTDMRQRWGKPQMKAWSSQEFSGVELRNQCHFQPSPFEDEQLSEGSKRYFLQELLSFADPEDELPLFLSHRRYEEEPVANVTLPSVHKSVKRALKDVAVASTYTPQPKPPTRHQLAEIQRAAAKQAAQPMLDVEVPRKLSEKVPDDQLTDSVQKAIRLAKQGCQPQQTDSALEKTIRHQLQDLAFILEDIVPKISELSLEEQQQDPLKGAVALAQSTPKETLPQTAAPLDCNTPNTPIRRKPLQDLMNRNIISGFNVLKAGRVNKAVNKTVKQKVSFQVTKETWEKINLKRPSPPHFPQIPTVNLIEAVNINICERLNFELPVISSPEDQIYFDEKIALSAISAVNTCVETVEQSDCEKWKDFRRPRFSASSSYSIFSRKDDENNSELWSHFLLNLMKPKKQQWTMARGLTDEPFAKARYELITGKKIYNLGVFCHPLLPLFGFSADGVVLEEKILVEVKSSEMGIFSPASEIIYKLDYIKKSKENKPELRARHKYYGQVQLGMALLSLRLCHLLIYASHDDNIVIVEVPFNVSFVKEYLTKLSNIFFKHQLPLLRKIGFQ